MRDPRDEQYAELLVGTCVDVQPGWQVVVAASQRAKPLADEEGARPVLAEARQRVLVLVDDGHVPALALELKGDGRADAAAADDQGVHPGCSVAPLGSSREPCGKATMSTSAGDFRRT